MLELFLGFSFVQHFDLLILPIPSHYSFIFFSTLEHFKSGPCSVHF